MINNICNAKNISLAILFFLSMTKINAQSFYLTGHVFDGKAPLTGASILISNKHVGNSDASGYFEVGAKLGDTLKINFPFYEVATLILTDSLHKKINLTAKTFQLDDVQVNFNKGKTIDSLLNISFSQLKSDPFNAKVFLRQSVIQNDEKVRLLNEGLLSVNSPDLKELVVVGSSKKVKLNVDYSCNLINTKVGPRITYGSNPQIKLRLGLLPGHFYELVKLNITEKSIKSDSVNTIIQVKGNLALKEKVEVSYIWILDQKTNALKQSQYYEQYVNKKFFFFYDYAYRDYELYSALISAKQVIGRNSYSTNDEIFIFKQSGSDSGKWNFDANKCGLEKYVEQTGNCDELKNFKTKHQISARSFF
ncbi:carboxypeptidase-like regulatory domain-containing protein [Pedobacter sp. SG908]|uniref:carboxypeptidase-like regulatory domain-containing protein n=2 Tax=unclassified Pedobacter TaxID=2628915 RepID=UPI001420984C|nr:carboxypeptidase-like regulatory domain-containing protein [Pedobacter sp. SG908]